MSKNKSPLFEYGKKYFKQLLDKEPDGMKYGNELKFGIIFYDKTGQPHTVITETIKKEDLK